MITPPPKKKKHVTKASKIEFMHIYGDTGERLVLVSFGCTYAALGLGLQFLHNPSATVNE